MSDPIQTPTPSESKEQIWEGYYSRYLAEAERRGIRSYELLDQMWWDGRATANEVLPYISQDATVLEIACGVGRVSRFVAPCCKSLYCTDILDEALREVALTLADAPNAVFRKTNGYDLSDFDADFFDCVYSFTTFFHFDFELVVVYFAEIKRVLRPGGVAVLAFKKWVYHKDVVQLLDKIESQGGIAKYEKKLDKWRYVSTNMLALLCDYYDLEVVDPDVTKFTFRKKSA